MLLFLNLNTLDDTRELLGDLVSLISSPFKSMDAS
jgi:hypothetical protein